MEQTQENKTAGKKEISYPKFIQERLDRIPWEELEASYGIRKDYILGNEQVARQLASGQVTDYVRCYAKVGNSRSSDRWRCRPTSGTTGSK